MSDLIFRQCDLQKAKVKYYHWLFLWLLPTYTVLEGDSAHYFKKLGSRIFYVGEEIG